MKPLFFLLCLLNIGFFLWQFNAGRVTPSPSEPAMHSSILLVSEYARARRGAAISATIENSIRRWRLAEVDQILENLRGRSWTMPTYSATVVVKAPKPREVAKVVEPVKPPVQAIVYKCVEAGPFVDQPSLKKWLVEHGLTSKQVFEKESTIPNDFQVFYPAAKTPEQSRINKLMLNAKGFQDIWLIPSGDNQGGYSLGVFKEKQRAINFKNQLVQIGIQAELKQREKTKTQWFARVMLDKAKLHQLGSQASEYSSCAAR